TGSDAGTSNRTRASQFAGPPGPSIVASYSPRGRCTAGGALPGARRSTATVAFDHVLRTRNVAAGASPSMRKLTGGTGSRAAARGALASVAVGTGASAGGRFASCSSSTRRSAGASARGASGGSSERRKAHPPITQVEAANRARNARNRVSTAARPNLARRRTAVQGGRERAGRSSRRLGGFLFLHLQRDVFARWHVHVPTQR